MYMYLGNQSETEGRPTHTVALLMAFQLACLIVTGGPLQPAEYFLVTSLTFSSVPHVWLEKYARSLSLSPLYINWH